jgi:hypothetical protein
MCGIIQSSRSATSLATLLTLPIIALLLSACSSDQGRLNLVSADEKHRFSQQFTQAYIARNETGDADIVLVQEDVQPRHPDPTEPLSPDPNVMPRELVHIRVFWKPMNGVKPDHPANTNASIHWCFVCQRDAQAGVIEYTGSGLVEVSENSMGATVTIRKAWMKEECECGELVDPLGPSILEGTFHATHDPEKVKEVIAQIKTAGTTAEAQAGSPVGDN